MYLFGKMRRHPGGARIKIFSFQCQFANERAYRLSIRIQRIVTIQLNIK
jgi:hypothetical protein